MKWTTTKPHKGGWYWRGVKNVRATGTPIPDGVFRVLSRDNGSGAPLMFERQWQTIPDGFLWARVPEPTA